MEYLFVVYDHFFIGEKFVLSLLRKQEDSLIKILAIFLISFMSGMEESSDALTKIKLDWPHSNDKIPQLGED